MVVIKFPVIASDTPLVKIMDKLALEPIMEGQESSKKPASMSALQPGLTSARVAKAWQEPVVVGLRVAAIVSFFVLCHVT